MTTSRSGPGDRLRHASPPVRRRTGRRCSRVAVFQDPSGDPQGSRRSQVWSHWGGKVMFREMIIEPKNGVVPSIFVDRW